MSTFEIVDLTRGALVRGGHPDAPAVVGSIDTQELAAQIESLRQDLDGTIGRSERGLGVTSLVIKLTLGAEGRVAFVAKGSVEASIEVTFTTGAKS